jgi:hypothetical protein
MFARSLYRYALCSLATCRFAPYSAIATLLLRTIRCAHSLLAPHYRASLCRTAYSLHRSAALHLLLISLRSILVCVFAALILLLVSRYAVLTPQSLRSCCAHYRCALIVCTLITRCARINYVLRYAQHLYLSHRCALRLVLRASLLSLRSYDVAALHLLISLRSTMFVCLALLD